MSDGEWFAAKRFGIGIGLPIAWQGWALVIGYNAIMIVGAGWLVPRHHAAFIAVAVILTAGMLAIAAQHSRGGWRWRWGGE